MKAAGIYRKSKSGFLDSKLFIVLAKKNLGLPNLFPHKKRMIEAMERKKQNEDTQRKLAKLKKKKLKVIIEDKEGVLETFHVKLKANQQRKNKIAEFGRTTEANTPAMYFKELHTVLELSDVSMPCPTSLCLTYLDYP